MPPARKKRAAHGEDSAPPSGKQARTTDAASRVDGTEENSARAVRNRRGAAGAVVQGQVSQLHLPPPLWACVVASASTAAMVAFAWATADEE